MGVGYLGRWVPPVVGRGSRLCAVRGGILSALYCPQEYNAIEQKRLQNLMTKRELEDRHRTMKQELEDERAALASVC